MTEAEMKDWIDGRSYEELLRKWRFAKVGDPFFRGETGKYYSERMAKARSKTSDNGVSASKSIGW